jgi:hypothetical protein
MFVAAWRRLVLVAGYRRMPAAFGAAAKAVLQRLVELALEFGVRRAQAGHFGEQFTDQSLKRPHVVGKRGIRSEGRGFHA